MMQELVVIIATILITTVILYFWKKAPHANRKIEASNLLYRLHKVRLIDLTDTVYEGTMTSFTNFTGIMRQTLRRCSLQCEPRIYTLDVADKPGTIQKDNPQYSTN